MKIIGSVVDKNEEPLVYANIVLKSGNKANKVGAITSSNGSFVLDNDEVKEDSIIAVSFIGFETKTFIAKDLNEKKIVLQEDVFSIGEVVVTGKPKGIPTKITKSYSNIREHIGKHKVAYAGLGGLLGLVLIATSLKLNK